MFIKENRLKSLFCIMHLYTFSGQFGRQCIHFGNGAGNFGRSSVRRPVGHDSAAAMSKLVALIPNYMQIVQNCSEKGIITIDMR